MDITNILNKRFNEMKQEEENHLKKRERILYHIIPLKYFLDALKDGHLNFSSVGRWAKEYDAYEMITDHMYMQVVDGCDGHVENVLFPQLSDETYAMSWTNASESAYMWDEYAKDENAVRLGIKWGDIEDALMRKYQSLHNLTEVDAKDARRNAYAMLEVEYFPKNEIIKLRNNTHFEPSATLIPECIEFLRLKRLAFKCEREVRGVIYCSDEHKKEEKSEFLHIPIHFLSTIKSITFHPNLDEDSIERIKHQIQERVHFSDDVFKKSCIKLKGKKISKPSSETKKELPPPVIYGVK